MPEVLSTGKLADGREVKVIRIITPDLEVSDKIKRYFMGSFSYQNYRQYANDQMYWRLYYREALDGHTSDYVEDRHYLAEVEGTFAARIWFAYGKKRGRGNFGNVYTEPEYRQLGLMNMLMKPCMEDFHACTAKMLCCASGNQYAVASYVKNGFKLIYGGTSGPLCLGKVDFFEEEDRSYPGGEPLTVRAGQPDDQFDCDKFLFYTRAMYGHKRNKRVGLAASVTDYRKAFQECLSDNGVINVADTPSGNVAGYAFAINTFGDAVLDFTVHFGYMEQAPELLRRTAEDYKAKYGSEPLVFIAGTDIEREALVRAAGFKEVSKVPGHFTIFQ